MKLGIEFNETFILIDNEECVDNIPDDEGKEYVINYAMEVLEQEKIRMATERRKNGVKEKTLGIHPLMRSKRNNKHDK